MKKLILFLLLLSTPCWGQDYARMNPYILGGGASAAAVTYCTSSTACGSSHCNVICEDIESTTDCGDTSTVEKCRLTWTELVSGAGTSIAFDNSPSSGLTCTSGNNQNILMTVAGASGHVAGIRKNLGADYTNIGVSFYLYLANLPGNFEELYIFNAENGSSQTVLMLSIYGQSGSQYLRAIYMKDDSPTTAVVGTTDLAVNTWYRISLWWEPKDANTGTFDVYVNDTQDIHVTDADTGRIIRYLLFGSRIASSLAHTDQFKNIRVDSTQRPEACE